MKYNEGDHIQIKSLDWYNKNKNEHGYVLCGEYYFVPRMSVFCGKILTIDVDFEDGTYLVEEDIDGFIFTDEMIECKVEEEVSYDTESEWLKHEIALPDGYIFKDENGNVINATKIVLEKKKKEYPKTYEECCYVLGFENTELVFEDDYRDINPPKEQWKRLGLMNQLNKLLICRDAYWKIAGEKMGLDKPWKPDWEDEHQEKYIIGSWLGTIQALEENFVSHPLAFPTEEMRDAFKKNFDPDIEFCKELL